MTYKHLISFIKSNPSSASDPVLQTQWQNIKSNLIFIVGDNSGAVSCYLSEIMNVAGILYARYIGIDEIELKNRFGDGNSDLELQKLCASAGKILKRTKKQISNEALLFLTALDTLDEEEKYLLIDVSEDFYSNVLSKCTFDPYSVIFCSDDTHIDLVQSSAREIICLTQEEIFDIISQKKNRNGVRISYASPSKKSLSSAGIMGCSFYYNEHRYSIKSPKRQNIMPACIAIETAISIFGCTKAMINKGLSRATLPVDLRLICINPNIFFTTNELDLSEKILKDYTIIKDGDYFCTIKENTVFCGSNDFLDTVQIKLKNNRLS